MRPERSGPSRADGATEAGCRVAEQHVDTANRAPAQRADPLVGIRLRGFRPVPRGALIGFADIELLSGLLVHDRPVFRAKDGSVWAGLPAKPVVDRDGRQKADVNGTRRFAPLLEWRSRERGDRFSAVVIALIEQACPGALGGAAP
jgi:hypothetical protein